MALTSTNCAAFLKTIITTGSALRTYINAMPTGTDIGSFNSNYIPLMCLDILSLYGIRLDNSTNLSNDLSAGVLGVGLGSLPATNTTYFPVSSGFDSPWFLSQTTGTNTGVDYATNPCAVDFGATGHIRWDAPFSNGLVAEIAARASLAGISFEAMCAKMDSYFRISGDTTPGYCLVVIRQAADPAQITNCFQPGVNFYNMNFEAAVVYLSPAVATGSLSAFPASINNGESSTLTWTSTNATSASIDHGVGSVTPVAGGSVSVSPSVTTTYTITFTGDTDTITRTATVTVGHPLPEAVFTATPDAVSPSGTSTLAWTIAHGVSASIDHGIGSVDPVSGTHDVNPTVTTTYTLSMTNLDGSATAPATVTVVPNPTGTFAAIPDTIFDGQSTALTWTSSNAVTASIDQGIGSVSPVAGGSIEVFPLATTTYTITLTNSLGVSVDLTATVTVNVRPPYRQFFSVIDQTALRDWKRGSTDDVGVRFESFLDTCQSLDDPSLKTKTPYLYTFIQNGEAADSSVGAFVSAVWDWKQYGDPLRVTADAQVYNFHDGFLISAKKTRINGKGRSIHLHYRSDADKDFNLKGWVLFYDTQASQ